MIFLFAGGHQRKGNNHFSFTVERWKLKESKYFSKRIRFIENVKGVLSMSLVQNYWNLIGRVVAANVGEKKKKRKGGRKLAAKFADIDPFFSFVIVRDEATSNLLD